MLYNKKTDNYNQTFGNSSHLIVQVGDRCSHGFELYGLIEFPIFLPEVRRDQRGASVNFSSELNISMVREGGIEPPALLLAPEYLNNIIYVSLGVKPYHRLSQERRHHHLTLFSINYFISRHRRLQINRCIKTRITFIG